MAQVNPAHYFLSNNRVTQLLLLIFIVLGVNAYQNIPRQMIPDVQIPFVIISTGLRGVSPIDSETLLVKPMENHLNSLDGLKEMRSVATNNRAYITLEFDANMSIDKALEEVRAKTSQIQADIPKDANSILIQEINLGKLPVIDVAISGSVSYRTMLEKAKELRNDIRDIKGVLKVDIVGERKAITKVVVDPIIFEKYKFTPEEIKNAILSNHQLVTVGKIRKKSGAFSVEVPGLIKSPEDIMNLPLRSVDNASVKIKDVASVLSTFQESTKITRINGKPCLVLEVSKRIGVDLLGLIKDVTAISEVHRASWPSSIHVDYYHDTSKRVYESLSELNNSILVASAIVVVVMMVFLGMKSAVLSGIAIPVSFLMCMSIMYYGSNSGMNIVTNFAVIMAIGLLVDDAIVITEYSDTLIEKGVGKFEAYYTAIKDMSGPIFYSTATRVAAVLPIMLWPGFTGKFMRYIPLVLCILVVCSLFVAVSIIPACGMMFKNATIKLHNTKHKHRGIVRTYERMLRYILIYPKFFCIVIFAGIFVLVGLYGHFNHGVMFFPDVEPEYLIIYAKNKDGLSLYQKDEIAKKIEDQVKKIGGFDLMYTQTGSLSGGMQQVPDDGIAMLQLELSDWQKREKAVDLMKKIKHLESGIPGVIIDVQKEKKGPVGGKPIKIILKSKYFDILNKSADLIEKKMRNIHGIRSIEDSRRDGELKWNIVINREKADILGSNVASIGAFVQIATNGLKIGDYTPMDSDDKIDIMLQFPEKYRDISRIKSMKIMGVHGMIPMREMVSFKFKSGISKIDRTDRMRSVTISADIDKPEKLNKYLTALQSNVNSDLGADLNSTLKVEFAGEIKDQTESRRFLHMAFAASIILIVLILTIQFNSFFYVIVIMTAAIFSLVGSLVGLMITGKSLVIVMFGIGSVSLAGIIVNNNILLIDAFRDNLESGMDYMSAIIEASVSRFRPILLTVLTAALGLVPMALKLNIDILNFTITHNAPSSQWWDVLSVVLISGLLFATILTLIVTPSLIVIKERIMEKF